MNQAELILALVLGAPEEVVDFLFHERQGILCLDDPPDACLFNDRADAFGLPKSPAGLGGCRGWGSR